ncbi:MAG TPA: hypothetical protein PKB09_00610 [Candidatus Saccharibacteria bacterium]|nr:hypothetical protein [Candidatus Saccharibacteria bacterium]
MSETITIPAETSVSVERDENLRRLLGMDYNYALDSGLLDIFARDSDTGDDGALHILTGISKETPNGGEVVEGFHHAPSAELVTNKGEMQKTYVSGPVMGSIAAKRRNEYVRYPFGPHNKHVVIEGRPKLSADDDGSQGLKFARNSMYPDEYDPLAVLETVKYAYDSRDPEEDIRSERQGEVRFVNESTAPLIDGLNDDGTPKTPLRIRLVMDEDHKIISAIPVSRPNILKLTKEEIDEHLGL